jgi:hypothetical protein
VPDIEHPPVRADRQHRRPAGGRRFALQHQSAGVRTKGRVTKVDEDDIMAQSSILGGMVTWDKSSFAISMIGSSIG